MTPNVVIIADIIIILIIIIIMIMIIITSCISIPIIMHSMSNSIINMLSIITLINTIIIPGYRCDVPLAVEKLHFGPLVPQYIAR